MKLKFKNKVRQRRMKQEMMQSLKTKNGTKTKNVAPQLKAKGKQVKP